MLTGVSDSKVAASMGRAEFLAPEIRNSPESRVPPLIKSLSMGINVGLKLGKIFYNVYRESEEDGLSCDAHHCECCASLVGTPYEIIGLPVGGKSVFI